MPVVAMAMCVWAWRWAPIAMARATGSLTAPNWSISAASTPIWADLAALEYVTQPRSNQALEPDTSVQAAAIPPPVQLSAVASNQPRAIRWLAMALRSADQSSGEAGEEAVGWS